MDERPLVEGYIANFGMSLDFLSFCVLDDFFRLSKKLVFWVFLVHPTVVLVLLSASVERCFVSHMRDFFKTKNYVQIMRILCTTFNKKIYAEIDIFTLCY